MSEPEWVILAALAPWIEGVPLGILVIWLDLHIGGSDDC